MSDAYLLDTSIASIAWDGFKKHHLIVRQKLTDLDEDSIFVCSISLGEVEYGLQISSDIDEKSRQAVRLAMLQYNILDVDRHTAEVYGKIRAGLFKRYASRDAQKKIKERRPEALVDRTSARELGIQENDLWIVSVAVQYDLRFITRDKKIRRILDITKDVFSYDRADIWDLDTLSI